MAMIGNRITVALSELQEGMVLPADIADARNETVLLLRRGIPITQALLQRLRSRGIQRVTVDADSAAIIRGEKFAPAARRTLPKTAKGSKPGEPPLPRERLKPTPVAIPSEQIVELATEAHRAQEDMLRNLFAATGDHIATGGQVAREIVNDSIAHILADLDLFVMVALQSTESSESHQQCLAASQLAMCVGVVDGFDEQAIKDLGVGCMLSRIGQSAAATRCADQPRQLSPLELLDVRRTPSRTFDLLQTMRDVPVGARNVAYQIFERFDGSGYPRRRAGNQIAPLARIAAVCDAYAALTSPRSYRPAYEPYAATSILLAETRRGKFDPAAVRGLLRAIGLFATGSFVQLTDGSIGQVVRNQRETYDRPVVHLVFDCEGRFIKDANRTVDLSTAVNVGINAPVPAELVRQMSVATFSSDVQPAEETFLNFEAPLEDPAPADEDSQYEEFFDGEPPLLTAAWSEAALCPERS